MTTLNVPTVFRPSHPSPVVEERKIKDSMTALIHQVFVRAGNVVPILVCWMMSKKPTSLLNVLTLMNALLNQDQGILLNVITLTSSSFHRSTVTKTPLAVISPVAVMKTPLVPIMMVGSLALVMLAGIPMETLKQVHSIILTNFLKLTHTGGANSKCFDNGGTYYCQCLPAFHMVEGACVDGDECATNNNDCHASRSVYTNETKTYTMKWISGVAQYTMSGR